MDTPGLEEAGALSLHPSCLGVPGYWHLECLHPAHCCWGGNWVDSR